MNYCIGHAYGYVYPLRSSLCIKIRLIFPVALSLNMELFGTKSLSLEVYCTEATAQCNGGFLRIPLQGEPLSPIPSIPFLNGQSGADFEVFKGEEGLSL